ncbi:pyridoxamine 5'-phosphate oxidase family protein [Microbacterium sp. KNMS]
MVRRRGIRAHRASVDVWLDVARATMRARYCLCITDAPGGPRARAVQPFRPDDDLVVHFGTSPHSRKAAEIRRSGRVVLSYLRERDGACVTVRCAAEMLEDAAARRRWFMPFWRAFWPAGPDDPAFVVVRCVAFEIELWDARRRVAPPPFGLAQARLVRDPGGEWRIAAA